MPDETEIERLRRRTHALANALHETVTKVEVYAERLTNAADQLDRIESAVGGTNQRLDALNGRTRKLEDTTATLQPVKALVYGFVGIVMISVVGALLALVVTRHG